MHLQAVAPGQQIHRQHLVERIGERKVTRQLRSDRFVGISRPRAEILLDQRDLVRLLIMVTVHRDQKLSAGAPQLPRPERIKHQFPAPGRNAAAARGQTEVRHTRFVDKRLVRIRYLESFRAISAIYFEDQLAYDEFGITHVSL
jgi:hypothetical protein